jgi:DNA-binding protein HU-beta
MIGIFNQSGLVNTGRNPATGAVLKFAASNSPKFTAGATFKTAVAGKKAKKK